MLWIDKYRPRTLDDLVINKDFGESLKKLVSSGDCPHLLFYGPPGAGKKTLIIGLLKQIYGPAVEKIKVETKPWKIALPSRNIEIELTTVQSNYHVEMNPSDVGNQDRHIVQEVIKDMCKNRPLELKGTRSYKILLLNEVDRLSREAQHSLRRTMEKYSSTCRLIFSCSNVSKVIDPLRSRCLCIRVAAPTLPQIEQVLDHVAQQEEVQLPEQLRKSIAQKSERNLRRALLMLETCRVLQTPMTATQEPQLPDWELYIQEIARDIFQEQSPKQLYQVRGKLYELLVNCLPPELILRKLALALIRTLDDEVRHKCIALAAAYEHRLQEGQKAIYHLEAFVAKMMSEYKTWSIAVLG
ncbi:g5817 [Coccomyxa viridis]|uniref:G5817 protein n=1 Tax=Coccomyxa viridis TaxID=1274662 RepID=A0ABP1G0L6_9CHLO